jgi:hypothetical protein
MKHSDRDEDRSAEDTSGACFGALANAPQPSAIRIIKRTWFSCLRRSTVRLIRKSHDHRARAMHVGPGKRVVTSV